MERLPNMAVGWGGRLSGGESFEEYLDPVDLGDFVEAQVSCVSTWLGLSACRSLPQPATACHRLYSLPQPAAAWPQDAVTPL